MTLSGFSDKLLSVESWTIFTIGHFFKDITSDTNITETFYTQSFIQTYLLSNTTRLQPVDKVFNFQLGLKTSD